MKTFGRVLVLLATAAVAALFLVDDSDQDLLFSRVKVATGVEEGLEDGQAMITRRVAVAESAGVRSVPPGTVVELVEARGRTALLRDEVGEFEATLDQFTTDSAVAAMIRSGEIDPGQ